MYNVIVIGGGHAGCEAALSAARLGNKTLMITGNFNMIANMPCNPSIGGPAKGIVVREIDALGGEMGRNTDKSHIQMRLLNISKGPAVRALRAQADKVMYPKNMKETIFNESNLEVIEAYVKNLIVDDITCKGVTLEDGTKIISDSVIITTGTYMESKILVGDTVKEMGPDNQKSSIGLSSQLRDLGFRTFRLKTGTPPRVKTSSVDFSKTEKHPGDIEPRAFSFDTTEFLPKEEQWPCYLTYTNLNTHDIIHENLTKSSMYSGVVEGVGPRYCPSIEDKIVRFNDKERHQIFLEPESKFIPEIYVQGFSTSLPHDVQDKMIKTIPGLENCEIVKYAYAIEYDAIDPTQLWPTLESKIIENLYFAGQVNGTSGYEEAGCQGLMAGINASLKLNKKEPLILKRNEAYIGVLIDDLVTKGTKEPYRLLTSRAEYRLLLRHDNADLRLRKYGHIVGLVNDEKYNKYLKKISEIDEEKKRLNNLKVTPTKDINEYLNKIGSTDLKEKTSLYDLLKRPELNYRQIVELVGEAICLDKEIYEQVEIDIKYEGYIKKALKQADKLLKVENQIIPKDINYNKINNLAIEAKEKLSKIRPLTIGQASRISGVNPSDISILLIYIKTLRDRQKEDK